jgi:DNA-binding NarL/FixJ family response regulator
VIRLLIADDHSIVREGLRRIIDECEDIEVVGEARDSEEIVNKVCTVSVDVVLLDLSMPGRGFLETIAALLAQKPQLRILVLSVHSEEQFVRRSLRAGAAGYLTKDRSPQELAEAIRTVHRGGTFVDPALSEVLQSLPSTGPEERHEALSQREYQVLCKLGSGRSVTQIATDLELSPKTVSTYRSRILEKLHLTSSQQLMRYALEHGLID